MNSTMSLMPVSDKNTNDNFRTVIREINLLKDSVNAKQESVGFEYKGKEGDIRISEDTGKNKHLDIDTKDGWFTSFNGCFQPKNKEGLSPLHLEFLEVDNLYAKQFTARQTQAMNGDFIFADCAVVDTVLGNTVTFKDQTNMNLCPFAVNDLIITRRITADKSLDIKYVKATVTAVSGRTVTVTYKSTDKFATGDVVARVGNSSVATRRDSILISTNETYTPYIDIYDGILTWTGTGVDNWDYRSPLVRVGNLGGISGSYGHGIYIAAGGELRIESGATVVGVPGVQTYNQSSAPSSPNDMDVWNRQVTDGIVATPTIVSGGTGYSAGDILTVNGGTGGKIKVLTVNTGVITSIALYSYGYGYTTGTKTVTVGSATFGVTATQTYNLLYRYDSGWVIIGSTGTQITGDGIYTGLVEAQQVIAGTLTGFTIQTSSSGKRVVIDNGNTIKFYPETGSDYTSLTGTDSGFFININNALAQGAIISHTSSDGTACLGANIQGISTSATATAYGISVLASGVSGGTTIGVYSQATGGTINLAGYFVGDVYITGALTGANVSDWDTAYGWGNWASNFGSTSGKICQGDDSRLSDADTAIFSDNNTYHSETYITASALSGYASLASANSFSNTNSFIKTFTTSNNLIVLSTVTTASSISITGLYSNAVGSDGDGSPTDQIVYSGFFSAHGVNHSGNMAVGVYGSASGGETNWAGYFAGNVYLGGNVEGGTWIGNAIGDTYISSATTWNGKSVVTTGSPAAGTPSGYLPLSVNGSVVGYIIQSVA